jgi:hypothetical protein
MTLLVAALVFFAAFHLLPGFDEQAGWRVWPNLGEILIMLLKSPDSILLEPDGAVAIASFLTVSLLIVASPFLTNVWRKSRLAWWIVVIFSGLTSAGFSAVILMENSISELESGAWCLLISPGLNFIGLLLVRGKSPEPGFPPPGNDNPIA